MPRKKIGGQLALPPINHRMSKALAEELKNEHDHGQPLIYEEEHPSKKIRVVVIWDRWAKASLEERTSIILQAYELAEGEKARDRIGLAGGLTVPEATVAGMLPYQVIAGLRKTDPFRPDDVRAAMLEQGATKLDSKLVQLRFATRDEAEACVKRLTAQIPGSEPIWIISRDIYSPGDYFR